LFKSFEKREKCKKEKKRHSHLRPLTVLVLSFGTGEGLPHYFSIKARSHPSMFYFLLKRKMPQRKFIYLFKVPVPKCVEIKKLYFIHEKVSELLWTCH